MGETNPEEQFVVAVPLAVFTDKISDNISDLT
jgi:hypothetical protein